MVVLVDVCAGGYKHQPTNELPRTCNRVNSREVGVNISYMCRGFEIEMDDAA